MVHGVETRLCNLWPPAPDDVGDIHRVGGLKIEGITPPTGQGLLDICGALNECKLRVLIIDHQVRFTTWVGVLWGRRRDVIGIGADDDRIRIARF
ncbi:MAG TPA: hypothetical protein DIU15_03430, partial [Deltaproteobacteria bacterium]|nr:hypothetical protein [Deltaproteobacteria bacterium]